MKHLLLSLLLVAALQALELKISSGIEDGESYSILYIQHEELFNCKEIKDTYGKTTEVLCAVKDGGKVTFSHSESKFFRINGENRGSEIFIHIFPKSEVVLKSVNYNFSNNDEVLQENSSLAKKWEVIAYEKNIPFLKKKERQGINFPIAIETERLPQISALDSMKNPLVFEESKDVPLYLRVKQLFQAKEYSQVIYNVDDILGQYPDSIFKKELLLYRIRAMNSTAAKEDMDDLVNLAKSWVKTYSADEAVSEVLLMLANAYSEMGFFTEARYYFDRIFFEHKGERYEKLAKISLGDQYYLRGDANKAINLYNEALLETKDIDVASLAAAKIAEKSLDNNKGKEASEYYLKILGANPPFFQNDYKKTMEICEKLANSGENISAAKVCSSLLDVLDKKELEYDKALKAVATWYDEGGEKRNALELYTQYLDELDMGISRAEVKQRLDALAVDIDESNTTKRLQKLDALLLDYPDSEIYKNALLAKAQILFEQKRYVEVLGMKAELLKTEGNESDGRKFLESSASEVLKTLFDKKDCNAALNMLQEYDGIEPDADRKKDAYECFFEASYFNECFVLADSMIKEGEIGQRLDWMYKSAKCAKKLEKNVAVDDLSKDILDIAKTLKTDKYNDILYERFYALSARKKFDDMLTCAQQIDTLLPLSLEHMGVYKSIVQYAEGINDDTLLLQYATKIFALQEQFRVSQESPWVDFLYIQSALKTNQIDLASSRITKTLALTMSDEQKARALYTAANIAQLQSKKDDAKGFYSECAKIKTTTPWKKLCVDALAITK